MSQFVMPKIPPDPTKPNETIPGGLYMQRINGELVPVDCNGERLDLPKVKTQEEIRSDELLQKIAELENALKEKELKVPPTPATPPSPPK